MKVDPEIAKIKARGFWDAGVEVVRVKGKRHYIKYLEDNREPNMSFCNFCGEVFTRQPSNVCAECAEPQDN